MDNPSFIKKHLDLQAGLYWEKPIKLKFSTIVYSKVNEEVFSNFAFTNKILSKTEIQKIDERFANFNRNPSIYFENRKNLSLLEKTLVMQGYKKDFEDSWMFYGRKKVDKKYFGNIKEISSAKDLEIFLKVFESCYQRGDPQNPYGELGKYLEETRTVWLKFASTGRVRYFMAYQASDPVAVSSLTNFDGLGYISGVGSIREVRGEGFGKAATLFSVQESIDQGNKSHYLITEEGHYPNEFYKRIGFKTKFRALSCIKKPAAEILDLVNENDEIIGEVEKDVANQNPKLIHREIGILIFNNKNEVLFQQRSLKKKIGPGLWIISASGHVPKGLSYEQAAHKELQEELGFDTKLIFIKNFLQSRDNERHYVSFYIGKHSGEKIKIQEEEIAQVKFFSKETLEKQFPHDSGIASSSAQAARDFWDGKFGKIISKLRNS